MRIKNMILVLFLAVTFKVIAQGYPVIDITNIIASIENGYTLVQQLEAMYNNIQNSYEQLQKQIKSFESFDFNELDARDPLGSWRSIMTYADRMMTYEENIESILNNKNLKIGNASYSLGDLLTSNSIITVAGMMEEAVGFVAVDPFERKLSPEEKAIFHQKYGMSYGHYMRYNYIGEALQKKAAEIQAYNDALEKELITDRKRLDEIVKVDISTESTIKNVQKMNSLMIIKSQDLKTMTKVVASMSELLGKTMVQNQERRKARHEEQNLNNFDLAEGLVRMIEGDKKKYK
jgi:conjugal transfer/entry exclusion protein